MPAPVYEVRTFSQYVDRVAQLYCQHKVVWWRGHSKSSYVLLPSAMRNGIEWNGSGRSVFFRFWQKSSSLPSSAQSDFDWLFAAQHYGVPTPLLDWTEDPICALYFALCGMATEEKIADLVAGKDRKTVRQWRKDPPCVWFLDPTRLNAAAQRRHTEAQAAKAIEMKQAPPAIFKDRHSNVVVVRSHNLQDWAAFVFGNAPPPSSSPLAIAPPHGTPRILAQRGSFTLHSDSLDMAGDIDHYGCLWDDGGAPGGEGLACVVIRRPMSMLKALRALAIDRFRYFPEMAEAAQSAWKDGR